MASVVLLVVFSSHQPCRASSLHEGQPPPAGTELHFSITPGVRQAYNNALELKLDAARDDLIAISTNDPGNLLAIYVEDLVDFLEILVTEDYTLYALTRDDRDERLQALKAGNEDSPYYLFTQAEVHMHWAVLRFRFQEYFSAAAEVNRAFRLLKKNQDRFPEFAPNMKSLGILKAGVGTIPDKYMWAIRLFSSMDGSIPEGLALLEQSIEIGDETGMLQLPEAQYLYAQALYHFANDGEAAWSFLEQCNVRPTENLLHCVTLANMAYKTGRNDRAIEILEQRPKGSTVMEVPYLDLMMGRAKLCRLDEDANIYLQAFIDETRGENYVKEAHQKLAWYALLQDDLDMYENQMQLCLEKGGSGTEEDKYAFRSATREIPDPQLLRGRLLFDGAYYRQALEVVETIDPADLTEDQRLELTYRTGRIYHALGKYREALLNYARTIREGQDTQRYYPCNAALKSAEIYEKHGEYEAAKSYYKTCLDFRPDEYQSSIHQKAKSGLQRLRSL